MKASVIAFAAIAAAAAMPAYSQETDTPAFDPVFTGPRVEVFGGAEVKRFRYSPGVTGAQRRHTGGVAGVLGGFDLAAPYGLVAGVFGSYAIPTTNFCANNAFGCVRTGREVEGGARLGYLFGSRAMVYVKGAYVNASYRVQSRFTDGTIYNTYVLRDSWRAGAGGEYALSEHAYVKAEYNYTRPKSLDLSAYGHPGVRYRQIRHQFIAGFGVRF